MSSFFVLEILWCIPKMSCWFTWNKNTEYKLNFKWVLWISSTIVCRSVVRYFISFKGGKHSRHVWVLFFFNVKDFVWTTESHLVCFLWSARPHCCCGFLARFCSSTHPSEEWAPAPAAKPWGAVRASAKPGWAIAFKHRVAKERPLDEYQKHPLSQN